MPKWQRGVDARLCSVGGDKPPASPEDGAGFVAGGTPAAIVVPAAGSVAGDTPVAEVPAALEAAVHVAHAELDGHADRIENLTAELDALRDNVRDAEENSVNRLSAALQDFEQKVSALVSARLSNLPASGFGARFSDLNEKLAAVDALLTGMHGRIDALDEAAAALRADASELRTAVNGHALCVDHLDQEMRTQAQTLATVQARLDALQHDVALRAEVPRALTTPVLNAPVTAPRASTYYTADSKLPSEPSLSSLARPRGAGATATVSTVTPSLARLRTTPRLLSRRRVGRAVGQPVTDTDPCSAVAPAWCDWECDSSAPQGADKDCTLSKPITISGSANPAPARAGGRAAGGGGPGGDPSDDESEGHNGSGGPG